MGTLEEKKRLRTNSNVAIVLSFVLYGLVFMSKSMPPAMAGLIVTGGLLGACVSWITGMCYYARSKGYSGIMGLLGILTILGLLVLIALPDQWKFEEALPTFDPSKPPMPVGDGKAKLAVKQYKW